MIDFLTMDDFDFKDKTTLLRVDFNSPVDPKTKKILDDTRIRRHAGTIKELSEKGAKVVILAHQGRPRGPDYTSLKQHGEILSRVLGEKVKYVDDIFGEKAQNAIKKLKSGEILILKNVRDFPEESKTRTPVEHAKSELVKKLAPLADIFVNDAFAAAHRSHASMVGFTTVLPTAAGRVMEKELNTLSKVMEAAEKPCVYILGGVKAEDADAVASHVLKEKIADMVLTGGVVSHLFLIAAGKDIGAPNRNFLEKKGFLGTLPRIKDLLKKYGDQIEFPYDLAVKKGEKRVEISIDDLPTEYPIYDIGTKTVEEYSKIIKNAKTIVVSGPMGVYEDKRFMLGTRGILDAVVSSEGFSVVGGGHTIAAVEALGLSDKLSYVSTGGGSLIDFLSGKKLPVVKALEEAALKGT